MGKPDIQGKVDTINSSGSTNNSLLLAQRTDSQKDKESGSLSHFANKNAQGETKKLPTGRSFRNTGGQSFLKAAIFRNMEKNRENDEESKDEAGPGDRMIMSSFTNQLNNSGEKKTDFSLTVEKVDSGSGDDSEKNEDKEKNSPKQGSNSPESSSNMISKSIMKRFTSFGEKK